MKVFIVCWHDYDDSGIDKVFAEYEKAAKYIKYRDTMTGYGYSITEKEVEV